MDKRIIFAGVAGAIAIGVIASLVGTPSAPAQKQAAVQPPAAPVAAPAPAAQPMLDPICVNSSAGRFGIDFEMEMLGISRSRLEEMPDGRLCIRDQHTIKRMMDARAAR